MNRYKLSKVGISVNEGVQRFNGDIAIYELCLNKFLSDEQFKLLTQAILEKDIKSAFSAAHALKGEAGNLSLTKLYNDICPLVEELRNNRFDKVPELMEQVTNDYNAIIDVLTNK